MENRPILSAEEALEMLSSVHPEIHRGLDSGCSKADTFFEADGNEVKDRSLRSMLVRYWGKSYLQENFPDVQFDNLSLCGISILLKGLNHGSRPCAVRLRIWKSFDNQLPSPGDSDHKIRFYTQPTLFPGKDGDPGEVIRLAVLWNLTGDGVLDKLWLVAPKKFNQSTGAIDVWWRIEIPDPATSIAAPPQAPSGSAPDLGMQKRIQKKEQQG